jgi:hypothetical protein
VVFPESVSRAIDLIEARGPRETTKTTSTPKTPIADPASNRTSQHSEVKSV